MEIGIESRNFEEGVDVSGQLLVDEEVGPDAGYVDDRGPCRSFAAVFQPNETAADGGIEVVFGDGDRVSVVGHGGMRGCMRQGEWSDVVGTTDEG